MSKLLVAATCLLGCAGKQMRGASVPAPAPPGLNLAGMSLEQQAKAINSQIYHIGGKTYKYSQFNTTDGTLYAATHLKHDIEPGFFCPDKFIAAEGRVDVSDGADKKSLFNHKYAKSRQGCCMLDKVVAFMEVIHLLRTCKTFEIGTVDDGEQNQQTRSMNSKKADGSLTKEDKWGRCDAGAMATIFWHMRACCVDKVFFFDHSERSCVRLIHQVMRDTQSLQREYKKCTGGGNGKPVQEKVCKDVEDGLMALVDEGNKVSRELYNPAQLTADAKEILSVSADDTRKGTFAGVNAYLKKYHGVPDDGEKCMGC